MTAYASERENELAPAFTAEKKHDYQTAFRLFQKFLDDYPNDARALMLTAEAARLSGHLERAAELYHRSIEAAPGHAETPLIGLLQTDAALGRWDDFEATQKQAREASLSGNKFVPENRVYVIEDYREAGRHIQVVEYPKLRGQFHTRYRFFFLSEFDPQNHFTPYIDVESDDIDQIEFAKQYPEKAATGDRSFSIDSYPAPRTQGLIKFYPEGEPTYKTVRADVFATLSSRSRPPTPSPVHTGSGTPVPQPGTQPKPPLP